MCVNVCLNWTFTTDGEFMRIVRELMLEFDVFVRMGDYDARQ